MVGTTKWVVVVLALLIVVTKGKMSFEFYLLYSWKITENFAMKTIRTYHLGKISTSRVNFSSSNEHNLFLQALEIHFWKKPACMHSIANMML